MKDREKLPALTRREFVALVASGSAAVLASPLSAATAATAPAPVAHHAAAGPVMSAADRKEFERQRKSTIDTVATLRKHKMGPGTEMASVFRPIPSSRRSG